MRVLFPLAAVSALAAAALAPGLLAAQGMPAPARKSGWWEMTMQMSAPMPMTHKTNICVDASQDAAGGALQGPQDQRMPAECKQGPVGRNAQGWTFSNTCTMQNMTVATSGVASGDFQGNYRVETTTRMTPAPMPQMAETKTVITGKYMGPCPANRKPGTAW
jgi:hypothetical protein